MKVVSPSPAQLGDNLMAKKICVAKNSLCLAFFSVTPLYFYRKEKILSPLNMY